MTEKVKLKDIIISNGMAKKLHTYGINTEKMMIEDWDDDDFVNDNIEKYIEVYQRKEKFPPVILDPEYIGMGKNGPEFRYRILDGRHRITAALIVKKRIIKATDMTLEKIKSDNKVKLWYARHSPQDVLLWLSDHRDYTLCEIALKNGADLNLKDKNNETPLFLFFVTNNELEEDFYRFVKLFKSYNGDFNVTDNKGDSILIRVVKYTDELSDLNLKKREKKTNYIKELCKLVNINLQNKKGNTALIEVCKSPYYNDYLMIKLLVDSNADRTIKDNNDHDAEYYILNKDDLPYKQESLDILNSYSWFSSWFG